MLNRLGAFFAKFQKSKKQSVGEGKKIIEGEKIDWEERNRQFWRDVKNGNSIYCGPIPTEYQDV
jgi:hypothetical protein